MLRWGSASKHGELKRMLCCKCLGISTLLLVVLSFCGNWRRAKKPAVSPPALNPPAVACELLITSFPLCKRVKFMSCHFLSAIFLCSHHCLYLLVLRWSVCTEDAVCGPRVWWASDRFSDSEDHLAWGSQVRDCSFPLHPISLIVPGVWWGTCVLGV